MMMVPETSVIFNQPIQVKLRDFINFSLRESLAIWLDWQRKGRDVDNTYITTFECIATSCQLTTYLLGAE
jgi:hypothetical protein